MLNNKFSFAILGSCGVLMSMVACGPVDSAKSTDTKISSIVSAISAGFKSPWGFSFIPSFVETEPQNFLNFTDLSLKNSDLITWNTHARGVKGLPDGMEDDLLTVPSSGASDLLNQECLDMPESWKVSQVRLAPFESLFPGQPNVYEKYSSANNQQSRLLMQLRLSLHPVCADAPFPGFEEQAHHVIFNLFPNDAFKAEVYKNLIAFKTASLSGKVSESKPALDAVLKKLNSEEYKAFRESVLKDFAPLAILNGADKTENSNKLQAAFDYFSTHLVSPLDDRTLVPEITSKAIKQHGFEGSLAFSNSPEATNLLKNLLKKYSQKTNLARVASLITVGEQDAAEFGWYFSLD